MIEAISEQYNMGFFWTWILLWTRMGGVLIALPGVGTDAIPQNFKNSVALMLGLAMCLSGEIAPVPENLVDGGLMMGSEFLIGYILGAIPSFIVNSLSVTGQVVSGSIGLGMANMIDPSIGQSMSVLSRIESSLATMVFLLIDGHHVIFRAAGGVWDHPPIGSFHPDMETAMFLLDRFGDAFELAIICSSPVMVSILITQFVLGIITKSVPQVNIFIISLPLTIGMGLYVTVFTFPGMINNIVAALSELETHAVQALWLN